MPIASHFSFAGAYPLSLYAARTETDTHTQTSHPTHASRMHAAEAKADRPPRRRLALARLVAHN
jgi:hypothetical protein